jgi:hypothetical protein
VGKANAYMTEDNSGPDDMDGADDEVGASLPTAVGASKRKTSMIR